MVSHNASGGQPKSGCADSGGGGLCTRPPKDSNFISCAGAVLAACPAERLGDTTACRVSAELSLLAGSAMLDTLWCAAASFCVGAFADHGSRDVRNATAAEFKMLHCEIV